MTWSWAWAIWELEVRPGAKANSTVDWRRSLTRWAFRWTGRARGSWNWPDGIETPLHEETERYLAGVGDTGRPLLRWELTSPSLELSGPAGD